MRVRLERPRYGGTVEGRNSDGLTVTVPFALPGEIVEINGEKPSADSELIAIIESSPNRGVARCVHFGICGGCQYQHVAEPTQIALKIEILRSLLADAGLSAVPQIQPHTAHPWGYRNRIRVRVEFSGGEISFGYSRRGTNEFLAIRMCPIAAPLLWRALETLRRLALEDALCRRWLAAATEVELFCAADEGRLQIALFLAGADTVRHEPEGFAGFCARLKAALPELTGASASMDAELSRRTRRTWDGAEWGAAGLSYEAAGAKYWVSRGAFFQVNRFLVNTLVALVTDGRRGRLAWDLFAGVGLFSRALVENFAEVVSVEGAAIAARDLEQLARTGKGSGTGLGTIRAVHAPALEFLRTQVLQRTRPELIVMDPPRAGVGEEGCRLLGRLRVPDLVYVSCDPVTLARDLKVLTGAGYTIAALHLVDLFPQTFHLETVVSLRYGG